MDMFAEDGAAASTAPHDVILPAGPVETFSAGRALALSAGKDTRFVISFFPGILDAVPAENTSGWLRIIIRNVQVSVREQV